tara:strand:+ start:150 stop:392 length:243 start_codon:yes stop_codon:yes gene_type:complete
MATFKFPYNARKGGIRGLKVDPLLQQPLVNIVLVVEFPYPVVFKVFAKDFVDLTGCLGISQFQLLKPVQMKLSAFSVVFC